jgi:diguanylate cyclase (GGDEF)-like protein
MADDRAQVDLDHDAGRENVAQINVKRDRDAGGRDKISEAHDGDAEARDFRAHARDQAAIARDKVKGIVDAKAAWDRAEAHRDRREAALDRARAATDRLAAWSDRLASAEERLASSIDGLTGAYRREPGMMELEREVARAKRSSEPLMVAFLRVDGLKDTNDSLGHAVGDRLLRHVSSIIRSSLRPYDLIIRFWGDEFVCGLVGLSLDEANKRFVRINAILRDKHQASVSIGLSQLEVDDSLESLITRADESMHADRRLVAAPRSSRQRDDARTFGQIDSDVVPIDPNKVDLLALSREEASIVMFVLQDQPWPDTDTQLLLLQEKIHNYVSFALDGQLHRQFPEAVGLDWNIHVEFRSRVLDDQMERILKQERQAVQGRGGRLTWDEDPITPALTPSVA